MIDIGVNLTNSRFDRDRAEVIARALNAGITQLIITGTDLPGSERALAMARAYSEQFPGALFSTAGIHPHDATSCTQETLSALESLIRENSDVVVAVGETGLDFNRNFSPPEIQIAAFERQIELAIKLGLPLFLHERDAFPMQRDILRGYGQDLPNAVIHCFTGNRQALEAYLEMGLWIGITGWVCDERRGLELQSLVPFIPPEKMMVETDAPYLTPRNLRPKPKSNRNEPCFLGSVVETIARCLDRPEEQVSQFTSDNARVFFSL